jgi:hypothetical protein
MRAHTKPQGTQKEKHDMKDGPLNEWDNEIVLLFLSFYLSGPVSEQVGLRQ